jgi:hypothetical protein
MLPILSELCMVWFFAEFRHFAFCLVMNLADCLHNMRV